jgi:hypothetical protein
MHWSLGVEHQFGATASLQAQYVGTRAVDQPYLTQVNGYQTARYARAVSVCAANRSEIWRGDTAFDRRQQQLQRPALLDFAQRFGLCHSADAKSGAHSSNLSTYFHGTPRASPRVLSSAECYRKNRMS